MKRIWDVKIRPSIRKEFANDPMMQELHEIRARLSQKYQKSTKKKLLFNLKKTPLEMVKAR